MRTVESSAGKITFFVVLVWTTMTTILVSVHAMAMQHGAASRSRAYVALYPPRTARRQRFGTRLAAHGGNDISFSSSRVRSYSTNSKSISHSVGSRYTLWIYRGILSAGNTAIRPSFSLAAVSQQDDTNNDDETLDSLRLQQQDWERELQELNHGQELNPNSQAQVYQALYGPTGQSPPYSSSRGRTTREALLEICHGRNNQVANARLHRLAACILQWRQVASRIRAMSAAEQDAVDSVSSTASHADAPNVVVSSGPPNSDPQEAPMNVAQAFKQYNEAFYQGYIDKLFDSPACQMHDYWREALLQLTKPSARDLVAQLDPTQCPMGFDPSAEPWTSSKSSGTAAADEGSTTTANTKKGQKGTLLGFVREQKAKYPDCILLIRCGDFYETFGVDSIMMVEHCGLNAMGGRNKAGCPIANVQTALDDFRIAGFRIAVYEEATDTDASAGAGAAGGSKSRLKHRFFSQIVSDAAPTYFNDLLLADNADMLNAAQEPRPFVGVLSKNSGYTLVEVWTEARTVRVSERLTAEAVACRLAANPPADPFFYVPSPAEFKLAKRSGKLITLPFHPSRKETSQHGAGARTRTKTISPNLVQEPSPEVNDAEIAKNTIVSELLKSTEGREEDQPTRRRATAQDFTLVSPINAAAGETQTGPLYVETAKQLGLMDDPAIPSLMSYILPDLAPAATRRFLRQFLLTPPPPRVAEAMRELVFFMKEDCPALPPLNVPPLGKILALFRSGQAPAQVYSELLRTLQATVDVLDILKKNPHVEKSLMILLMQGTGIGADPSEVRARCLLAMDDIERVVSQQLHHTLAGSMVQTRLDLYCDFGNWVPANFFERNERKWRGHVRQDVAQESYAAVEDAAANLALAIAKDFWLLPEVDVLDKEHRIAAKSLVMHDKINNLLALAKVPAGVAEVSKGDYFHPRDRNSKILTNRYTTDAVQSALSEYVAACDLARQAVSCALAELSQTMDTCHGHAVNQAAHSNMVLSSAFHHAAKANSLGWNMAEAYERTSNDESQASVFNGVWPYWIERDCAVANSFSLDGMNILTAPNMSGKSTVMRSTAAAALLTVCGMCAPLEDGSRIQRFDHLLLRGASSDVPAEKKSAFGAEMEDIAALFRCCGEQSLVFVDELGRGTSPSDGTVLAGAILEQMAVSGMSGFFATHLHDILNLPIKSDRIRKKRMAIRDDEQIDDRRWTYQMEDGVCTDSMALVTARQFGVPESVTDRAEAFSVLVPALKASSTSRGTEDGNSRARIRSIVESIAGAHRVKIETIQPTWQVPPSFEGKSALYILELDEEPPQYYIGQSDNFRQRLQTHRRKKGKWSNLTVFAFVVPEGKSQALVWENRLIEGLRKAGISVENDFEGRSVRSVRSR